MMKMAGNMADKMSEFKMDPKNPKHVRAYMNEHPWVKKFKQMTGKHPMDMGIMDEEAAKAHMQKKMKKMGAKDGA